MECCNVRRSVCRAPLGDARCGLRCKNKRREQTHTHNVRLHTCANKQLHATQIASMQARRKATRTRNGRFRKNTATAEHLQHNKGDRTKAPTIGHRQTQQMERMRCKTPNKQPPLRTHTYNTTANVYNLTILCFTFWMCDVVVINSWFVVSSCTLHVVARCMYLRQVNFIVVNVMHWRVNVGQVLRGSVGS